MTSFWKRLLCLWRTDASAVPDEASLYHACENVIAHGFSWPAYEVAELLNEHGWTSSAARAVVQRVMQRMSGERNALPPVEKPSPAYAVQSAHTHFGGSIREIRRNTYRFKDGRVLGFRKGRWVGYENEAAAA